MLEGDISMKINNTCVKCQSNNLRKVNGRFPMSETKNILKVTPFKNVYVTTYVCVECGYLEEWIEKEEDLEYLAKKANETDDFPNFV